MIRSFDAIKQEAATVSDALNRRAAELLDPAALTAFVEMVDELNTAVIAAVDDAEAQVLRQREENDLLRSLAGVQDEATLQAKIIEQGQELRFLRQQMIELKKQYDQRGVHIDEMALDREKQKREIEKERHHRKADRERFEGEIEELNKKTQEWAQKLKDQQGRLETERQGMHRQFQGLEDTVYTRVMKEFSATIERLRDLTGAVAGSAEYCLQRWGAATSQPYILTTVRKYVARLMNMPTNPIVEITPDLELIQQYSRRALKTLNLYLEVLRNPVAVMAPVSWMKVFDNLKRTYFPVTVKGQTRIEWPVDKKYPPFVCDEGMVVELFSILIANALESFSPKGTLEISGSFSSDRVTLTFKDNGIGIPLENRARLFLPFFTTKPGHIGLGLTRAQLLARVLKAEIRYEPLDKGSIFVLDLPAGSVAASPPAQ